MKWLGPSFSLHFSVLFLQFLGRLALHISRHDLTMPRAMCSLVYKHQERRSLNSQLKLKFLNWASLTLVVLIWVIYMVIAELLCLRWSKQIDYSYSDHSRAPGGSFPSKVLAGGNSVVLEATNQCSPTFSHCLGCAGLFLLKSVWIGDLSLSVYFSLISQYIKNT